MSVVPRQVEPTDQETAIHVLGLIHDQRDLPSAVRNVLEIGEESWR